MTAAVGATGARGVTGLAEAEARLAAAGVASPRHDARVLLAHAARTGADPGRLIARRADREPLQHVVGSAGFRYLDLAVGPGVFVPRPETELLVDHVLTAIADVPAPRVVDLCAGTGAIGLSVAQEYARARVDLVESSPTAFEWLRRNADGRERVTLHLADLADAPTDADGTVDVVVSNPPYLPHSDREAVEPEVGEHDPVEALWADDDGLAVIRRVVDRAATLLRPGGTLVVEHSDQQQAAVTELVSDRGFTGVAGHPDLAGRPRFVTAVTPW